MTTESDDQLWALTCYHGLLPREDVNEMLVNEGDYLVRKSEETPGAQRSFVLSVMANNDKKHYLFRVTNRRRLTVDSNMDGHATIREFVDHHQRTGESVLNPNFPRVVLRTAIRKQWWELAHSSVVCGAELGNGAFGVVRRGQFQRMRAEQIVYMAAAIKEAYAAARTKDEIKEFMHEARMMRRLDHDNVIKFFGVAAGKEPLMIVMELATKGALKDYLRKHKRSGRSKFYMCWGAARGLEHIHDRGIIHCDIAARNCLFSTDLVKIADFGLAHEGTSRELDRNVRLPIKWLAPETIRARRCTTKSDVWSYGVLCWEIFKDGQQPYSDLQNNDVARRTVNGEQLDFGSDASLELKKYFRRNVWNRDENDRHSMEQVVRWFGSQPPLPAGPGPSATPTPSTSRDRN